MRTGTFTTPSKTNNTPALQSAIDFLSWHECCRHELSGGPPVHLLNESKHIAFGKTKRSIQELKAAISEGKTAMGAAGFETRCKRSHPFAFAWFKSFAVNFLLLTVVRRKSGRCRI